MHRNHHTVQREFSPLLLPSLPTFLFICYAHDIYGDRRFILFFLSTPSLQPEGFFLLTTDL
jgi:hypothetical protein